MIIAGILFLFILLSGFWLSRLGKPYNGLVFNIHKLIGLGEGIYLIRTVYLAHQAAPLDGTQWATIAISVVLFLFAVVTGGLLSIYAEGRLEDLGAAQLRAIETVHKVAPYLILVSTAVLLYLLM